jgi:hypothetical protein
LVPPLSHGIARNRRTGVASRESIVDDDDVAAFARRGAVNRRCNPVALMIVLETDLGVLVAGQIEAIAPVIPIPLRLNEPPALHVIAGRKRLGIGCGQKPDMRAHKRHVLILGLRPGPRWPRHRNRQRFHVTRRHVDDEPLDLATAYRFEVLANGVDVPV